MALVGALGFLAACGSVQDDGNDKLYAIEVPAAWKNNSFVSGGEWSFEYGYRTWGAGYAPADGTIKEMAQVYDSALVKAGWSWHATCTTRHEYSSAVEHGCWRLDDYMLVYRVAEDEHTLHYVSATMYRDN